MVGNEEAPEGGVVGVGRGGEEDEGGRRNQVVSHGLLRMICANVTLVLRRGLGWAGGGEVGVGWRGRGWTTWRAA
jgi:hypothetical protein